MFIRTDVLFKQLTSSSHPSGTQNPTIISPPKPSTLVLPSGYVKIAIENGHRNSKYLIFPLKMVIFHSYVSLPEGNPQFLGISVALARRRRRLCSFQLSTQVLHLQRRGQQAALSIPGVEKWLVPPTKMADFMRFHWES